MIDFLITKTVSYNVQVRSLYLYVHGIISLEGFQDWCPHVYLAHLVSNQPSL